MDPLKGPEKKEPHFTIKSSKADQNNDQLETRRRMPSLKAQLNAAQEELNASPQVRETPSSTTQETSITASKSGTLIPETPQTTDIGNNKTEKPNNHTLASLMKVLKEAIAEAAKLAVKGKNIDIKDNIQALLQKAATTTHSLINDTSVQSSIEEAWNHQNTVFTTTAQCLVNMERKLACLESLDERLKAIETNIAAKTWAQVAATNATQTTAAIIAKHQRTEHIKKARSQFEFMLSIVKAEKSIKTELAVASHKEIMQRCQSAIDTAVGKEDQRPTLRGIIKLPNGNLRLQCR